MSVHIFLMQFFRLSPLIFALTTFFSLPFTPSTSFAQCNSSGCFSQPQPVFFVPSAAQEISIEIRKSSSQSFFPQETPQPVSFKPFHNGQPSTIVQSTVRTWSNGEGQWKNLSNGSACLVNSSSKSINSSPQCSDSF